MERTTIDFGIDLGTTNSSIAVLNGIATEVFRNNEGQEVTPSAVWIDSKGRLYVGRRAKERLVSDTENARSEFKLQMGTPHIMSFEASGRQMSPVELSAEILKSLRGDVQQYTGEEFTAAVIGVPAAFVLPQCDATNEAAQLAGLSVSPLIQEPVAAAMAYGFQSDSDRIFWMVYDFGGGTFDAAIIQMREGLIQLVNHGGDNQLGGKLIDWEIVEQLLVPAVKQKYALSDFTRGNPKWKSAFAKLKQNAEEAKIRISRDTVTEITIDFLCQDDHAELVRFEYELKRSDIEPLIEPFVERSVNICKRVLEEKRLSAGDLEKIILVGGPTLTPIVREILSDRLRISLDFHMDPLTVVARGAAIFAGTQRIPEGIRHRPPVVAGQYRLELEYEPIGSDLEPLIGGRLIAPEEESLAGFTIECVESKSQWRSGRIDISANGAFMTTVRAERGRTNEFLIELRDSAGNIRETVPDRFNYTTGISLSAQTLIYSIGVATATNEMDVFLCKGTPLPARCRKPHRTTVALKRGDPKTVLKIPLVEGENKRADRNPDIGYLVLPGDMIHRDLPLGSEVEITIDINESRILRARAYVPVLDEEIPDVSGLVKVIADPKQMGREFERERARLEEIREKAQKTLDPKSEEPLRRIQDEQMVHDVETSLAAAPLDSDAADKCQNRLLDLKSAIDEVEDALEWPTLVSEAQEAIEYGRKIVDAYAKDNDKRDFDSLESAISNAIAIRDIDLLHQKMDELQSLTGGILTEQPWFWVGYLDYLEQEKKSHMSDKALAERLIAQGRRAIDANDLNGLQVVVRQLIDLLPAEEQQEARGYGGTTIPIF